MQLDLKYRCKVIYMSPKNLGRNKDSDGTYVMTIKHPISISTHGIAALATCSKLMPAMGQIMKRLMPIGGVENPMAKLTTITIPK